MPGVEAAQRFPFISLEKAVARAKQLFDADQRGNEMSSAGAFAVWNYSPKSSGGFQTIGALKAYGLLGTSENGKLRLTKEALDFFRDEREDERAKLLLRFALTPPFLRSLWEQWQGHPPADTLARTHLKLDRGLNEQSARAVLGIYKDNLAFANPKGDANLPEPLKRKGAENDPPLSVKVGDYVQWTSNGVDQFKPPRKVTFVAPDASHVRVHGSMTGVPMDEVTVVDPPALKPSATAAIAAAVNENVTMMEAEGNQRHDISVLLTPTGRLQISADVNHAGLQTLKEMLGKYEEILKLLERPASDFKRPT